MIALLAILWGVVGALLVIGLVWRRRASLSSKSEGHPGTGGSSPPTRPMEDGVDEEWIYGDRSRWARPQQLEDEARREAEAIVKDAELKALEILTSAERARSHVDAELAREQTRMAAKTRTLSRFLANAIEEVERAAANAATASIPDLRELRALRDELRTSEEARRGDLSP
jgi:hypothetical protein